MKIIKFIFFSFLALSLIACTGIFILFQTFNTDQYLLQINQKASIVLGRPVSVGGVGLGLSSKGITLDVGPVTVADDPDFTIQPFITVDKVRISLGLRSLILRREIRIKSILLQSPQIHFIRSLEGRMNVESLGKAERSVVNSIAQTVSNGNDTTSIEAPEVTSDENLKPSSKEHALFSSINVRSVRIKDAAISFIDQNQDFPLDIWLTNINARLNNFSLSKTFQLSLNASLCSNVSNVHANVLIKTLGQGGLRGISLSDLKVDTDLSQVDLNSLKGISPEMSNSPILRDIAGILQLNLTHLDIGSSGDMTTDGDVSITDGVIKNFNIIKALLSHTLGSFGVMDGHIDNFLNGPLKDKFGADDTIINKAQVKFSLHDKTVFIDDSLIQTNIFELTAKGSIDQGLNMDMETMLHLNADVSTALVDELDGLKFLCDDSKRISIEASLKGVPPHLKYKPSKDFRKKSRKAMMKEGANILGIFLGSGETSSKDQSKKLQKSLKNIFMNI